METQEPTKKLTIPRRPVKLTEKELHQIEEMAAIGLNQEQIASIIGISRSTLQRCGATAKNVTRSVEKGKSKGLLISGTALMKKVRVGDTNAIKWYEMTRHKMSERSENETTLKVETLESYLRRMRNDDAETIEVSATDNGSGGSSDTNNEYGNSAEQIEKGPAVDS